MRATALRCIPSWRPSWRTRSRTTGVGRRTPRSGIATARRSAKATGWSRTIARYHRENGGLLTEEDLAEYRSEVEKPLRYTFKGTDVLSCGPWCQGPVLLQ